MIIDLFCIPFQTKFAKVVLQVSSHSLELMSQDRWFDELDSVSRDELSIRPAQPRAGVPRITKKTPLGSAGVQELQTL